MIPVAVERRGADDHFARALLDQRSRALHGADAAADADAPLARPACAPASSFEPRPMAASRSITWISGNAAKRSQHRFGRIAFQRLFAALHQLDDLAVHQIDAGNDHAQASPGCRACRVLLSTGSPCKCRSGRSKPRARRRRSLRSGRGRNVRACLRRRWRSRECAWRARRRAVRAQSKPSCTPSVSMEVSRISPAPSSSPRAAHATASMPSSSRPPRV